MDRWFLVGCLAGIASTMLGASAWAFGRTEYRLWRLRRHHRKTQSYHDPVEGRSKSYPGGPLKVHSPRCEHSWRGGH